MASFSPASPAALPPTTPSRSRSLPLSSCLSSSAPSASQPASSSASSVASSASSSSSSSSMLESLFRQVDRLQQDQARVEEELRAEDTQRSQLHARIAELHGLLADTRARQTQLAAEHAAVACAVEELEQQVDSDAHRLDCARREHLQAQTRELDDAIQAAHSKQLALELEHSAWECETTAQELTFFQRDSFMGEEMADARRRLEALRTQQLETAELTSHLAQQLAQDTQLMKQREALLRIASEENRWLRDQLAGRNISAAPAGVHAADQEQATDTASLQQAASVARANAELQRMREQRRVVSEREATKWRRLIEDAKNINTTLRQRVADLDSQLKATSASA